MLSTEYEIRKGKLGHGERGRYRKLTKSGLFTPEECIDFANVPFQTQYFRSILTDRRKLRVRCTKADASFSNAISQLYNVRRWYKNGKPDPFMMLRHYEDLYKARYPDYESPWERKPKRHFSSAQFAWKVRNTLAGQGAL